MLVKIAEALLAREVLDADQVRRLAAGQLLDEIQPAAARVTPPAANDEDESRPRQKERTPDRPVAEQAAPSRIVVSRWSLVGSRWSFV